MSLHSPTFEGVTYFSNSRNQVESEFVDSDIDKKCAMIREAVRELYNPTIRILEQAKKQILAGEYTMVVSDDLSGRVPAAILRNVIDKIYTKKRYSPLVFGGFTLSGSNHSKGYNDKVKKKSLKVAGKLFNESKRKRSCTPPKALIVTDVIYSGLTVSKIGETLKEKKIGFDVAGMHIYRSNYSDLNEMDAKIFDGELNDDPSLYLLSHLNYHGLKKKSGEVVAEENSNIDDDTKQLIEAVYDEANKLSEEIYALWKKDN